MLCGAAVLLQYFDNNNMWSAGGGNGVGVLYMGNNSITCTIH